MPELDVLDAEAGVDEDQTVSSAHDEQPVADQPTAAKRVAASVDNQRGARAERCAVQMLYSNAEALRWRRCLPAVGVGVCCYMTCVPSLGQHPGSTDPALSVRFSTSSEAQALSDVTHAV